MKKIKVILQSTVMVLSGVTSMAGAVDIVVSGEAGVVWEGLPWTASGSNSMRYSQVGAEAKLHYGWPFFAISTSQDSCIRGVSVYKTINGVTGIRVTDNMILVPVTTGTVTYTDFYNKTKIINWRGDTNGFYWNMPYKNDNEYSSPVNGYVWCINPYPDLSIDNKIAKIVNILTSVRFNGQGHWVLYADGKQRSATTRIYPMYTFAMAYGPSTQQILPSNINVRVTRLKCTVNTPQSIDFGTVANSSKTPRTIAGEVSVACAQGSVPESLEVSLLARPAGGSVLPTDTTVGVQIGGETVGTIRGFIGERANEEAGCIDRPSSLSLNYLNQYKLGGITQSESAKNFTQPLVWTFCPVPNSKTGRATAAIELNATFK